VKSRRNKRTPGTDRARKTRAEGRKTLRMQGKYTAIDGAYKELKLYKPSDPSHIIISATEACARLKASLAAKGKLRDPRTENLAEILPS
jgi:hypothetical protein